MRKLLSILIVASLPVGALEQLDDFELSKVDGAGLGMVLEDFVFDSNSADGATLELSGIRGTRKTGTGAPVTGEAKLQVSRLYIAGAGSNRGQAELTGVDLGTVDNPYTISVIDGDPYRVPGKALMQFAAPERNSGQLLSFTQVSRSGDRRFTGAPSATGLRASGVSGINTSVLNGTDSDWMDLGMVFDLDINGPVGQSLQAHASGVNIDGTKLQLWGDDGDVLGNLKLNMFARKLEFQACNSGGISGCGTSVIFNNFVLQAELGYGDEQPLNLSVLPDGQLQLTLGSIAGKSTDFYNNYYANGPRIDMHIDKIQVGNRDFGSSTIANMQIQYLNVRTRDL